MRQTLFTTISWLMLSTILFQCVDRNRIDQQGIMRLTKQANDSSLYGHIIKDPKQVTQVYTSDAILLPPDKKIIRGYRDILRYYTESFNGPGRSLEIETENVSFEVIDKDHAIQSGTYSILYKIDSASSPTTISGNMLIYWKRVDGRWKIHTDMWH